MTLKIDVLPAPLRPMIPHRSPSATVNVMFLRSSVAPKEIPMLEQERRVTRARRSRVEFVGAKLNASRTTHRIACDDRNRGKTTAAADFDQRFARE